MLDQSNDAGMTRLTLVLADIDSDEELRLAELKYAEMQLQAKSQEEYLQDIMAESAKESLRELKSSSSSGSYSNPSLCS